MRVSGRLFIINPYLVCPFHVPRTASPGQCRGVAVLHNLSYLKSVLRTDPAVKVLERPEDLVRSLITQEVDKEFTTVVLFDSQNPLFTVSSLGHIEEIPRDSPKWLCRLLPGSSGDNLRSVRKSAVFTVYPRRPFNFNVLRTAYESLERCGA